MTKSADLDHTLSGLGRVTGETESSASVRSTGRTIGLIVGQNLLLFCGLLIYAGSWTWLDVRLGQPHYGWWATVSSLSALLAWAVIPLSIWVNFRLLRIQRMIKRLIVATVLSAVACGLLFIPYVLSILWLHLELGGTL